MKLLHLSYSKSGTAPRYILLLLMGERNNKYVGLDTSIISDDTRATLLAAQHLDKDSLEERLRWLREHCPTAFRSAYREIYKTNAQVLNEYDVKRP